MLIISLQHIPNAKDTRFRNWMLLKFGAKATSLRPKGLKAEARGYEAESEAKIVASRL